MTSNMEVVVHSTLHSVQGRVTVATDPSQTLDSLITAFCIDKGIPHRKEFVLRNKTQEELTNTKKLSACNVENGDVLYLGVKAVSENWACGCNQWWLLASVALLIGCAGIVAITILKVKESKVYDYGIVIDCGSSHTQLYVYRWEGDKENGTAVVEEMRTCKVKGPGISNYTYDPSQAGESIKPCLDEAVDEIPNSKQGESPLYLGATAGMRLLRDVDNVTAQAIMASVRDAIKTYSFKFEDKQARILLGKEEGAFSWITANYLSGRFGQFSTLSWYMQPNSAAATDGALDMGGASTQITFVPETGTDKLPPEYSESLVLYGNTYDVYTHSYKCYGINEAHRRYLAQLVKDANYSETVTDPCGPKDNITTRSYDYVFALPCALSTNTSSQNSSFTFVGGSDSETCKNQVLQLFNFSTSCPKKKCTFDGVYQPPLYGDYMAFSGFYYTMSFLNLTQKGANSSLDDFILAQDNYCNKTWEEVKTIPNVDPKLIQKYCFEAHYIYTILVEGYGFNNDNWDTLHFKQKINNADLGWTVGYMLNTSNILPADYPPAPISTVLFILLLLLFIAFLILALGFIIHARRLASRSDSQYQRMATYGSI